MIQMATNFRGAKRRRELDRKRKKEDKQKRLQHRRNIKAQGLDPDAVDEDGNLLYPYKEEGGEADNRPPWEGGG